MFQEAWGGGGGGGRETTQGGGQAGEEAAGAGQGTRHTAVRHLLAMPFYVAPRGPTEGWMAEG